MLNRIFHRLLFLAWAFALSVVVISNPLPVIASFANL